MWFRPITGVPPWPQYPLSHAGGGVSWFPENGSAYLLVPSFESLAFSSYFGTHFNLISVDLAEWSTGVPSPVTASFNGIKADGSVVSTSFTTDGVIDGTGPLADFQTFHFDSRFRDLVRVESPSWGYAIDNVTMDFVIPEPASGMLLGLGLLGVWCSRRPSNARLCACPSASPKGTTDRPGHKTTKT